MKRKQSTLEQWIWKPESKHEKEEPLPNFTSRTHTPETPKHPTTTLNAIAVTVPQSNRTSIAMRCNNLLETDNAALVQEEVRRCFGTNDSELRIFRYKKDEHVLETDYLFCKQVSELFYTVLKKRQIQCERLTLGKILDPKWWDKQGIRKTQQNICGNCGLRAKKSDENQAFFCNRSTRVKRKKQRILEGIQIEKFDEDSQQWVRVEPENITHHTRLSPQSEKTFQQQTLMASISQQIPEIKVSFDWLFHQVVYMPDNTKVLAEVRTLHTKYSRRRISGLILVEELHDESTAASPFVATPLHTWERIQWTKALRNATDWRSSSSCMTPSEKRQAMENANLDVLHSWIQKWDVIVVWKAHMFLSEILILFLRLVLSQKTNTAKLWLFGHHAHSCKNDIRFLTFAQRLLQDSCNPQENNHWISVIHRTWQITELADRLSRYYERLKQHFSVQLFEQLRACPRSSLREPLRNLFLGTMLPILFKELADWRKYLQRTKLRHPCWVNRFPDECSRFNELMKKTDWSKNDLPFLFMCDFVEQNKKRECIEVEDFYTNWWPAWGVVFSQFKHLGLHNQEAKMETSSSFIENVTFTGKLDGFSKNNAIIELKFCNYLEKKHHLQVLLYFCLFQQTQNVNPNYCELYNIRSGERLYLTCDKELFLREVQTILRETLSIDDDEFVQRYK